MDKSPEDNPQEGQNADDDLEILDRILQEDQSQWDEPETPTEVQSEVEDDFYIFEDEDEESPLELLPSEPRRIAGRFLVLGEGSEDERGTLLDTLDMEQDEAPSRLRILSSTWMGAAPVEDLLARCEQVRAASSALQHPALIHFDEAGLDEEGSFWLKSPMPQGESLAQLTARAGTLPPAHALEIIHQTLSALEEAHANGMAHGALSADTIFLAPKVGWSEENPFAVGVRITEVGLTELAAQGIETEADLLDCAGLLATLITGEHFDPESSDWDSFEESAQELAMSESLWTLLDTGLAQDPGDRYQSSKQFREALEQVPEFRPKPVGKKRSLVSNLLLIATICAVLFGTKERWWPAAKSEAKDSQPATENLAELAALREQAQQLEEERLRAQAAAAELERTREAQAQLQSQVDRERAQKEALQSKINDERALLVGSLEEQRIAAEAAREAERQKSGQLDSLSADLEKTQQRIQELESAVQKRARLARESINAEALAMASEDIERMLRALRTSNLINARQVGSELAENSAILAAPISLIPFFEALFDAHDELAALDARSDPFERKALIEPAAEAIAQAAELGKPAMTGDNASDLLDDPKRISGYGSALDSLTFRITNHRSRLTREFRALWSETLANPDLAPPLVMRRALSVGELEDGLREFVPSFVQHIEDHALAYGNLQLDKLNEIENLEAWRFQLASEPIASLQEQADTLESLSFARRFYAEESLPEIPECLLDPVQPEEWRERLSLAAAILDPAMGMRAPIGTRLLYHARTDAGEETWRWDTIEEDLNPPAGIDDSRVILQEFHDRNGEKKGQRLLRLNRVGLRLYEGVQRTTELLDLSVNGPNYSIYPWHATEEPLPPAKLRVSPASFRAFRQRLKNEPWRAFVVEEGRQTTHWTRELGLVKHDVPGRINFELVYAEFP